MAVYILNTEVDSRRAELIEQKLRAVISGLVKIDNFENIEWGASRPDECSYVLVILPSKAPDVTNFIDVASHHRGSLFFILIGDEISASEYKTLVRSGGVEWISADGDPDEILDIIARNRVRPAVNPRNGTAP